MGCYMSHRVCYIETLINRKQKRENYFKISIYYVFYWIWMHFHNSSINEI